ncbi:MAG: acyl-CoA thioesterase II [Acidimicrobiales bacterium]
MTASLMDQLAVDQSAESEFRSRGPALSGRVFGGLLIGQALASATATVTPGRSAHALHSTFVGAGTGNAPIIYSVEKTIDGLSFSTRRVVAHQQRRTILVLTAEFQDSEVGAEYGQPPTFGVPGPEGLPAGRYDSSLLMSRDVPIQTVPDGPPHARWSWFRPTTTLPDDPALHLEVLAYLSDYGPTRAARQPHPQLGDDARRMSVSLNHSIWFHCTVDLNDWVLVELAPVATGGGRGLTFGSVRTRDGRLVASIAQGVLLRTIGDVALPAPPPPKPFTSG